MKGFMISLWCFTFQVIIPAIWLGLRWLHQQRWSLPIGSAFRRCFELKVATREIVWQTLFLGGWHHLLVVWSTHRHCILILDIIMFVVLTFWCLEWSFPGTFLPPPPPTKHPLPPPMSWHISCLNPGLPQGTLENAWGLSDVDGDGTLILVISCLYLLGIMLDCGIDSWRWHRFVFGFKHVICAIHRFWY